MQKYQDILDNDERLRILGWEKIYHQAIHLPEQILSGNQIRFKFRNITSSQKEIYIWTDGDDNALLIQLLQEIYRDKLSILWLDEIPADWSDEKGWLIIPDYRNQVEFIPDAPGILYLSDRDPARVLQQTTYFSSNDIPANEGLGIFTGLLCLFLDDTYGFNSDPVINKIVAFIMQKAGVLARRNPLQINFAKMWAVRLLDADSWQIFSFEDDFQYIAEYWRKKLESWAGLIPGKGKEIYLSRIQPKSSVSSMTDGSAVIYADGNDLLCEVLSLYYLVNLMAVYTAVIK